MKRLFAAFAILVSFALAEQANVPVARDIKWIERHQRLVELPSRKDAEVVFLGDSITEHWMISGPDGGRAVWDRDFAPLKAVCLGISGDRTQHVLWRIANGALDGMQPKVVVLMIGTNNTGLERNSDIHRNTVPEAVDGVRAVVKALTSKLPDAKVLVLGIFPHGENRDALMRRQGDEINAKLIELHDGKQVYFWDIGRRFLAPDGTLSSGLSPDFVHLSEAGYQIWADAIAQPLEALLTGKTLGVGFLRSPTDAVQTITLDGTAGGRRFDGIGVVNGGGATSVLLKDYPEPQRSQILDLVYRPKFGASVSALLVEIPGDGNSTQGSMPSHMRTRDDLNYDRGYTWWIMREAKRRNPELTLDAAAWSAPGWIGSEPSTRYPREHSNGDAAFWSSDAVDFYIHWLRGLRENHGLELDAIGCRNEKGVSFEFAKRLKSAMKKNGFDNVKLHAFDNWPSDKFDFVAAMLKDTELRDAIDVISGHVLWERTPASPEVRRMADEMGKPIWNTEDHAYLKGFDCAISIVQSFNLNYVHSGATKVVMWYDIAGVYPLEPYSEDPAMILARSPWSGHYKVREALWGYAHYGQFTAVGWDYLNGASGQLAAGGSYVTLKSPTNDYSVIFETKDAKALQQVSFKVSGGLSGAPLTVWRSNAKEQFVQLKEISSKDGTFSITLDPGSIYSISTTRGQQKGTFDHAPADQPYPFPYSDSFDGDASSAEYGYLPRYTADIAGVFEVASRPDGGGKCLRQVIPVPAISWAPDWQPFTILGDEQWKDYEVSADVWLNAGDAAGVMGRVNHVGTGYGFIPKGYWFEMRDDGQCRLVAIRGKPDKKKLVGDAEQQALLRKLDDQSEGGEKVLGQIQLGEVKPGEWRRLTLRMKGSMITALVDGKVVITATDALYPQGMAGLIAGGGKRLSQPYYDNLEIVSANPDGAHIFKEAPARQPLYPVK